MKSAGSAVHPHSDWSDVEIAGTSSANFGDIQPVRAPACEQNMSYANWLVGLASLLAFSLAAEAQNFNSKLLTETTVHRDLEYVQGGHERHRLDLYLPKKADGPAPVIVWVHGGAWLGGSKEGGGPALPLVGKGYAVASINYRLSHHAIFPAQIEDCKSAIRWLRANAKKYNLDSDHIGVWGASAGGHLAALLGTSGDVKELEGESGRSDLSSRVQAVVDWFGPTDMTKMGGSHDGPKSPEARLLGGPVQENKRKAARANPITYVTKDDPPFLVLHGDKDPTVPFSQSELLVAALSKAGLDVKFRPIKGGGHGGRDFQSVEIRKLIEEFFDRHLKNGSKRTVD